MTAFALSRSRLSSASTARSMRVFGHSRHVEQPLLQRAELVVKMPKSG